MMVGRIKQMALCLAVLVTCTPALDVRAQDFDWNARMSDGETLIVRGISGDVRATLASGDVAEVVATKRGRSADFDDVTIEVFEERGTTVVCVIYHSSRRSSDCDGHQGDERRGGRDRNIRVSVDFEVRVPAGVTFEGRTVSGDVEARGLRSDVKARTVSGDFDSDFPVDIERQRKRFIGSALSGTIGDGGPRLSFHTVSGDVELLRVRREIR